MDNKILTLEQIKNMSTDDMISLTRQGYVLENNYTTESLQGDPNCLIPSPLGGCLLSKYAGNMILTVGALILGGYILFKVVSKKL